MVDLQENKQGIFLHSVCARSQPFIDVFTSTDGRFRTSCSFYNEDRPAIHTEEMHADLSQIKDHQIIANVNVLKKKDQKKKDHQVHILPPLNLTVLQSP